jgi:RNA-directed DNA polymerase
MSVQNRPRVTDPSDPQAETLREKVVASENLHRAWKQVKRNKGAAGVEGRDIAETEAFLREHWPAIRKRLLEETHKP